MLDEALRKRLAEASYRLHSLAAHYPPGRMNQIQDAFAEVTAAFQALNQKWLGPQAAPQPAVKKRTRDRARA